MQVGGPHGGLLGVGAAGQQPGGDPGPHVAGAGDAQPVAAALVPPQPPVGRGHPGGDAAEPDGRPGPAPASSRAAPGRVVVDLAPRRTCSDSASSLGFGVSTTRPPRWCTQRGVRGDAGQPERVDARSGRTSSASSRSPNSWVCSLSIIPGPNRTASAASARSRIAVGPVGADRAAVGLRQPAHQRLGQRQGGERGHGGRRRHLELAGAGPQRRLGGQEHRAEGLGAAADHQDRAARLLAAGRLGQRPVAQQLRGDDGAAQGCWASGSLVTSSASATRWSTSLNVASSQPPSAWRRSGSPRRWRPARARRSRAAPARSAPPARSGRP